VKQALFISRSLYVKPKNIAVVAESLMLGTTYRYWLSSFLHDEIAVELLTYDQACHNKMNAQLCVCLIAQVEEAQLAQMVSNSLTAEMQMLAVSALRLETNCMQSCSIEESVATVSQLLGLPSYSLDSSAFRLGANLTKREEEVLVLLAQGSTLKEIAYQLGISFHTVMSHRRNLCLKTGAKTLQQLALWAVLQPVKKLPALLLEGRE